MALVAIPPAPLSLMPSFKSPSTLITTNFGSLVFFLENDATSQATSKAANLHAVAVKERIEYFASPVSLLASRLLRDVRFFQNTLRSEGRQGEDADVDTVLLACKLSSVGYTVSVRNALGGGGSACFRNLRHEFMLVRDSAESAEIIVDLHFREQFEIPQPTDAYSEILAQVPETYVGPISKLMPIVQVMCTEMAESFKARGLTVPPWRKTPSVLSKWMPVKMRDVSFGEQTAAAEAAADHAQPRSQHKQPVFLKGSMAGKHSSSSSHANAQHSTALHTVKIGFAL